MNQDFDKEIESILRREARRSSRSPSHAFAASAAGRHMDADELSAYAEGALPDAARARYVTHLADCDSCRKIVSELVISQGVEREERGAVAQTVEAQGRSWREWLAALFSPPVLRYAVPALALFAVITVALLVAMRSGNDASFVAKNEPGREQSAGPSTTAQGSNTATTTTATTANAEANHETATTANTSASANASAPPAAARESSPAQTENAPLPSAPKTADLGTDERQQALNEQPRTADEKRAEKSAATTPPVDAVDRMKEKDDASLAAQKKQESAGTAADTAGAAPAVSGRRAARGAEPNTSTATGTTSETAPEERAQNRATQKAPAALGGGRRDSSGDAEFGATRVVAGRSFRQQKGVWVDTAYNSSRRLTQVKRDSEQYRALVADEPAIATAANALGNVIIVVKGRAYHIY